MLRTAHFTVVTCLGTTGRPEVVVTSVTSATR